MRYAVVVDAGSSGSRAHVYSWPEPVEYQHLHGDSGDLRKALLPIDTNAEWAVKVKPGISTYADDLDSICSKHIGPLLEKAREVIPKSEQRQTPLFFLATAGMRLLPEDDRRQVLQKVCGCLRDTPFYVPECATHVTMIDGEVEGIYGWLGLNYLVNQALHSKWDNFDLTYGFMDMGGASAQIAFVPDAAQSERHEDDLFTVRLRSAGGDPVEWKLFVATWLEFGANEALTRLREKLVSKLSDDQLEPYEHGSPVPVLDPCMPRGAVNLQVLETANHGKIEFLFSGSGSYDSCTEHTTELLNSGKPCKDNPCLFDGVHVPDFDFNSSKFVGVSEYWYTLQDIFANNGSFDQETLEAKIRELCNSEWTDVKDQLESGKLSSSLSEADVQRACFKSAWVLTVLDKGYNFPLKSTNPFGDPHNFQDSFQSAINVEGAEISWTLGRAVLYAASSVPAASNAGEVGHALYKSPWVPGGELTSLPWEESEHTEAPQQHKWTASAGSRAPYVVILVLLFIGVVLYLSRRTVRHHFAQLRRRFEGWQQGTPLPVAEPDQPVPYTFSPYSNSGYANSNDNIALQEFRLGMSTVTPTSNVPSRVSSRANLRSEWDH